MPDPSTTDAGMGALVSAYLAKAELVRSRLNAHDSAREECRLADAAAAECRRRADAQGRAVDEARIERRQIEAAYIALGGTLEHLREVDEVNNSAGGRLQY